MADDIVITGMGVVTPIGTGCAAFWDALYAGHSGAASVCGMDTSELPRSVACQVHDPLRVDVPVGRASRLAIAAAREALGWAGLDVGEVEPDRMLVVIGTTMGETEFIERSLDVDADEWLSPAHARRIATGLPGTIARNVRDILETRGAAFDLYGACAAGNMSIGTAVRELRSGRCDVVLAGGADGFSHLAFLGFMRLRIMAAETCRPFDHNRDGLLVGEGAAVFVLECEPAARARGATVLAHVLGCSNTCESYHPTRPEPNGDGLARATSNALAAAGLEPEDVDYVCAHGTGTPQNDSIEVEVLKRCFPLGVSFSSLKALTGHTMGAAAAVEAVGCVLSLQRQTLIPTWNLDTPIETVGPLDAVRATPRSASLKYVVNNSAGFGGYNSSVVIGAA